MREVIDAIFYMGIGALITHAVWMYVFLRHTDKESAARKLEAQAERIAAALPIIEELEAAPRSSWHQSNPLARRLRAALQQPSEKHDPLEPLQLSEAEAKELDEFRSKPSAAQGRVFERVPVEPLTITGGSFFCVTHGCTGDEACECWLKPLEDR